MWNSFSTAGPVSVSARITTFPGGGGDEIHAYVARPDGDGPFPGVVLAHHMPGFDEFSQEFVERLARHGYEVIAPDLYCRYGHGTPDDVTAKVRSEGGVHDESVVADCAAALAWLKTQPTHNGKTGILGTCSGGRHAVLVASTVPGFDAVIDLWGGGVVAAPEDATPARPVAPIEHTEKLAVPLLGLFGNDDVSPTADQVDVHEERLKAAGKDYEFHRYDDAGHGFFYYHTPMYRQEQAMDAWNRIFGFFADKLHA
ncbi:MAG TPA: dienelactone hydrolase family protein [Mycobacteriales bacterium]|jgi:carboxymethylenebutenolidase|nr:dienelactone hydrolase family protein [Mycobacteriales bacterium]